MMETMQIVEKELKNRKFLFKKHDTILRYDFLAFFDEDKFHIIQFQVDKKLIEYVISRDSAEFLKNMISDISEKMLVSKDELMETDAVVLLNFWNKRKNWIEDLQKGKVLQFNEKWIGFWEPLGFIMFKNNELCSVKYLYELEVYNFLLANPASQADFDITWQNTVEPRIQELNQLFNSINQTSVYISKKSTYNASGSIYVSLENQIFELPLLDNNIVEDKCWNPFVFMMDTREFAEFLVNEYLGLESNNSYTFTTMHFDKDLYEKLNQLLINRNLKRKEMLDIYVRKIKEGKASLVGGTTTDTRWQMFYEKGSFIEEYYDYRGDYPEKVVQNISEEKIRESILFYNFTGMFRTKE